MSCELLSFFVPLGWFTASINLRLISLCCELLSFFVPLGWFTADAPLVAFRGLLWIAFVLCTFGLIYSPASFVLSFISVVNCFRSLYLWVDLQRADSLWCRSCCCELLSFFVPLGWFTAISKIKSFNNSCELLSFFVPLGWFTAFHFHMLLFVKLWIAFVLCTFGLIYS